MGSTYYSLHYHLVFSTKNRQPLIAETWEGRLHEYLGGPVRGLDGVPEKIGGVEDHVHLLVGLKPTHVLADFVRELKKSATGWVREQGLVEDFAWQEGYAAFSVGPTARAGVSRYIANQREHHRKRSFLDELKAILAEAGVEFDPRYLE